MKEFTHTIADPVGIHARPAGILVKAANTFKSSISMQKGEKKADVKRLFALMSLAVKTGETVIIRVEGEDEDAAAQKMARLMQDNF